MKRVINISIPFMVILVGLSMVSMAQYERRGTSRLERSIRPRSQVSGLRTIQLSEPNLTGNTSIESVLARRRSVREFSGKKLTFSQIGQLAWAGQGITDSTTGFRTAPSAGALYPMALYIAINDGLFVYVPQNHSLEQVLSTDIRGRLAEAALNQNAVADAACDIIIAGSVNRLIPRYQNQSRHYMLLEAGHVGQNILLQAVGLNLGSVPIGAFDTNRVRELCQMNRGMEPLYIICTGYPSEGQVTSGNRREPTTERGQRIAKRSEIGRLKVAILIVPSMNFNDTELSETQRALSDVGVVSNIASTIRGWITGASGRRSRADMLITDINLNDCDGIIFIGGLGINEYMLNPLVNQMINQAINQGKIVGAISNAPNILANAGVLNGYRVTGLPTEQVFLERSGARYTGSYVEKDGQIITAINSQAARQFGSTVGEALNQLFGTTPTNIGIRSGPLINYTR
jgi:SagB-type dehydrogenase family enzyme